MTCWPLVGNEAKMLGMIQRLLHAPFPRNDQQVDGEGKDLPHSSLQEMFEADPGHVPRRQKPDK